MPKQPKSNELIFLDLSRGYPGSGRRIMVEAIWDEGPNGAELEVHELVRAPIR